MNRTPDMNCLICNEELATETNSHFIPVGFTKFLLGKRDKEEVYSFHIGGENKIETYYGRENPKSIVDSDEEIEDIPINPMSADYIFCPKCEKSLARIESDLTEELLIKIFDPKYKLNYTCSENECKQSEYKLNRIDSFKFDLFFISLIFRINLQHCLEFDENSIDNEEVSEYFREELKRGLYSDEKPKDWISKINYQVISTLKFNHPTGHNLLTTIWHQGPYVFFLDKYILCLSYEKEKFNSVSDFFGVKNWEVSQSSLNEGKSDERIITFIDSEIWDSINSNLINRGRDNMIDSLTASLSKKLKINKIKAEEILKQKVKELVEKYEEPKHGEILLEAFDMLMN